MLWDAATGAVLQTLDRHSDWVRSVAFSPDGKYVAYVQQDGTDFSLWIRQATTASHGTRRNDVPSRFTIARCRADMRR